MFAYLTGTVEEVGEGTLVLDVNQVGYLLSISLRDASGLPPRGSEIRVHTYLSVREDAVQLFGFLSKDDLAMFKLLLTVGGIGPKAALAILSALTADDIRFAVLSDDVKTLGKAPGVGNKTAKKMILELKDKLSLEEAVESRLSHASVPSGSLQDEAKSEAVQALVALGYSGSDALRAVQKIEGAEEMDTETLLKLALRLMI